MQVLIGFLLVLSLIGIPVGLVMCCFAGARPRGKTVAFYSGVLFAFALGFALVAPPKDAATATASTKPAESKPAVLTRSQKLANIRIGGLSWKKDGFGAVMMATFVIYNDNVVPVKDVEVTCTHSANSGTVIDSNSRTVYEVVQPNMWRSVVGMNMGFIHTAAAKTDCKVTDFASG